MFEGSNKGWFALKKGRVECFYGCVRRWFSAIFSLVVSGRCGVALFSLSALSFCLLFL